MQKVKDALAKTPFEKAALAMKILQFINAAALLICVIIRFITFKNFKSYTELILLFYFIGICAFFILFELGLFRLRILFYFMNYGFGRAVFSFLLGLLIVSG